MEKWKAENPGSWKSQVDKLGKDRRLPNSYGADIAGPIYAAAMRVSGKRPDKIDDLVMDVTTSFLSGAGEQIKPESLRNAITYVTRSIHNLGINKIKKHDRREHSLTRDTGEDEGVQEDLVSDHKIEDLVMDREAHRILHMIQHDPGLQAKMNRVHPDAVQYVTLMFDGYSDSEILGVDTKGNVVGEPMLHHPLSRGDSGVPLSFQHWSAHIKPKIFQTIKEYLMGSHGHHVHMASGDFSRKLDEQFGHLVQKGDVEGLLREERKVVQGYVSGLKALNGVLGELKSAIDLLVHVECPDPAFEVVWPTQQKGVVNLHNAFHTLQETKMDVLQTAYATESWFQKITAQLGSVAPRFEWPHLV
jgi:DNA-directed RNA polymerase specialized sigma24 family protein